MKMLKNIIKHALNSAGYVLISQEVKHQYETLRARFNLLSQNFDNLSKVYEHMLNERSGDIVIAPNERRSSFMRRLQGTPPSEAYFIVQSIEKTSGLEGDICEFGVAQGETSALLANEIRKTSKKLHLFDSFEGLPEPSQYDELKDDISNLGSISAYAGQMAYPASIVRSRLDDISFPASRYIIHIGFIEKVFESDRLLPDKVSFAYVDFDFYDPIKMALDFLHERMPTGGIVIIDDYDWFSTGAKKAVDEFIAKHNSDDTTYRFFVPDQCVGCFAILEKILDVTVC